MADTREDLLQALTTVLDDALKAEYGADSAATRDTNLDPDDVLAEGTPFIYITPGPIRERDGGRNGLVQVSSTIYFSIWLRGWVDSITDTKLNEVMAFLQKTLLPGVLKTDDGRTCTFTVDAEPSTPLPGGDGEGLLVYPVRMVYSYSVLEP